VTKNVPLGLKLAAIFFVFGALMCALTIFLLLFPGTALDAAWRLNPQAHRSFESLGTVSVLLMIVVGVTCAATGVGLLRGAQWGRVLAITVLTANLVGDAANAVLRHDYRTLIGIPVAGFMIVYLWRARAHTTDHPTARSIKRDPSPQH
jgi:hypothetical protein